MSQLSERSNE